jgi:hypothetical protein
LGTCEHGEIPTDYLEGEQIRLPGERPSVSQERLGFVKLIKYILNIVEWEDEFKG